MHVLYFSHQTSDSNFNSVHVNEVLLTSSLTQDTQQSVSVAVKIYLLHVL